MTDSDRAQEEALAWAAKIQDPAFDQWDDHCAWLEVPGNVERYHDAVLAIERGLAALRTARSDRQLAQNDNGAPARVHGRAFRSGAWGLGLAACVAAVVSVTPLLRDDSYRVASAAGVRRAIMLRDGTRIALNGDSVLRLRHDDPRRVTLERGEVFIQVAHDETRPFEMAVGGAVLRDVGTAFNVSTDDGGIQIAVREGAVSYEPDSADVLLRAGQTLNVAGDLATRGTVPSENVGAWRAGRLIYDDEALPKVAAEVSRAVGRPVQLEASLRRVRFTGVLFLASGREEVPRQLATMLDLSAIRKGNTWRLEPHNPRSSVANGLSTTQ
jgi:transmembrane sensor